MTNTYLKPRFDVVLFSAGGEIKTGDSRWETNTFDTFGMTSEQFRMTLGNFRVMDANVGGALSKEAMPTGEDNEIGGPGNPLIV